MLVCFEYQLFRKFIYEIQITIDPFRWVSEHPILEERGIFALSLHKQKLWLEYQNLLITTVGIRNARISLE